MNAVCSHNNASPRSARAAWAWSTVETRSRVVCRQTFPNRQGEVCPSTAQNRRPSFDIGKAELWEKAQPLALLRQTDFSYQFGVARIGAQGIEREVGPEGDQPVVFLVCDVEPLEGMVLVA